MIGATQCKIHPGSHAGEPIERESRIHYVFSRTVSIRFVRERMQKTNVVRHFTNMRQQIGRHFSGLPSRFEIPQRLRQISVGALKGNQLFVSGKGLAVTANQFRFVIERVDVTQGSGTKHNDYIFSFAGKMSGSGCVWVLSILRLQH